MPVLWSVVLPYPYFSQLSFTDTKNFKELLLNCSEYGWDPITNTVTCPSDIWAIHLSTGNESKSISPDQFDQNRYRNFLNEFIAGTEISEFYPGGHGFKPWKHPLAEMQVCDQCEQISQDHRLLSRTPQYTSRPGMAWVIDLFHGHRMLGWEGTANGNRVLENAIVEPEARFSFSPHVVDEPSEQLTGITNVASSSCVADREMHSRREEIVHTMNKFRRFRKEHCGGRIRIGQGKCGIKESKRDQSSLNSGPVKQNAKPSRYHPFEDISDSKNWENEEAQLMPAKTARTVIEVIVVLLASNYL
ncbi:hypothetical protein FXO38_24924 [Capsicum annuum]|nr:hypothetical protein FXO38_24924 [Capsicum annuum]